MGHALLLSLPPVFLVWSIIMFAAAIVAYTVQSIANGMHTDVASTWAVLGVSGLILVGVLAGLYTFSIIWQWQPRRTWISRQLSEWKARLSNTDNLPV